MTSLPMVSFRAVLWPSLELRRARYHRVRSPCPFSAVPYLDSSIRRWLYWQTIPSGDIFTWYPCFHSFTLFLLHHPGDYASTYAAQSSIDSQMKLRKELYEMAALLSLSGILGDVFHININMIYSEGLSLRYVVHIFLLLPLLNYSIRHTTRC
ncbi:hypothetical protein V1520DRAFT_12086 [Lipomyces starkeyi]|uniref:Uncharacterized protein n=1 Tax=Lipomyces starkeyi NRRL Y-11557 TaxID=675824 RepID=A0A1E3QEH5_LIPST|nr:hypothetical protein LIPSTDRAFT_206359 [Lipomyces starkeyi NRRL Y-11557]